MNILYQTANAMAEEKEALYIGELVAVLPFDRVQIKEVLITMTLMNYVSEQTGFVPPKYFLKRMP